MRQLDDDPVEAFEEMAAHLRGEFKADPTGAESLLLRAVDPEETAELAEVVIAAFGIMQSGMAVDQWDLLVANIRAALANRIDNTILGAWRADRIVGGVIYSGPSAPRLGFADGWAYVRSLGVAPEAGGRGVGRTLVEACVALARADDAQAIGLYTADVNLRARSLYVGMGFQEIPTPMTLYGMAYHAYVLQLPR